MTPSTTTQIGIVRVANSALLPVGIRRVETGLHARFVLKKDRETYTFSAISDLGNGPVSLLEEKDIVMELELRDETVLAALAGMRTTQTLMRIVSIDLQARTAQVEQTGDVPIDNYVWFCLNHNVVPVLNSEHRYLKIEEEGDRWS